MLLVGCWWGRFNATNAVVGGAYDVHEVIVAVRVPEALALQGAVQLVDDTDESPASGRCGAELILQQITAAHDGLVGRLTDALGGVQIVQNARAAWETCRTPGAPSQRGTSSNGRPARILQQGY